MARTEEEPFLEKGCRLAERAMSDDRPINLLLLFDSEGGLTEQLAECMAEGVRSVAGVEPLYRRLGEATPSELRQADALIVGSPNWGGMTGRLKDCSTAAVTSGSQESWRERWARPSPRVGRARQGQRLPSSSSSTCCWPTAC